MHVQEGVDQQTPTTQVPRLDYFYSVGLCPLVEAGGSSQLDSQIGVLDTELHAERYVHMDGHAFLRTILAGVPLSSS